MTRTEAAVLALRLAGLYLMLAALLQMADMAIIRISWSIPAHENWLLWPVASVLVRAIAGVVLFQLAPRLARVMADGDEPLRLEDHSVIGAIAIRLVGIVCWDAALSSAPSIAPDFQRGDWVYVAVQVGVMLVVLALGTWLFFSAPTLAVRLFGRRAGRPDSPSVACLASIVFSAAGLWIVASALPVLATELVKCFQYAQEGWSYRWGDLIAAGVRVALGTCVFLGSGGVARVWHRLSTAGLQHRNDPA